MRPCVDNAHSDPVLAEVPVRFRVKVGRRNEHHLGAAKGVDNPKCQPPFLDFATSPATPRPVNR